MNKTFTINPDLLQNYVNKEVKKKMIILYIVFGLFSLCFALMTHFHPYTIFPVLFFVVIGFVCYLSAKNGAENLARSLQITFTGNAIIKTHSKDGLDNLTKASMELNSMRYGQKFDCVIPFNKIDYTEILNNQIEIHSTALSFLTDNGVIKIPMEVLNYREILEYIELNSEIFKLTSRSNF